MSIAIRNVTPTMSAACYFCTTGTVSGTIPDTHAGDAIGACRICHVLACEAHGVRDPNRPAWLCVACDVNLQAVAAALKTGNNEEVLRGVSELLVQMARSVVSKQAHFEGRQASQWAWVDDESRIYLEMPPPREDDVLRHFMAAMPEDAKALLATALAMVDRLGIREDQLIDFLRRVHVWVPDVAG